MHCARQIKVCRFSDIIHNEADGKAKVEETITSLRDAFAQDPPNLAEAKVLSIQLKYWQGLEEAAKEWSPK
jgi:molecular chaperone HscB